MEPLTILASTIGLIGAFHLLSTTVERIGGGKRNSTEITRDDWYCFFKASDLLGTEAAGRMETQPTITDEQRRRQQANRPRLQA